MADSGRNRQYDAPGSSNQSSDDRPKKRNKQVIACDQCQKRKSRCELITEEGCRRCVVLKTQCSLLFQGSDVPVAHPSQLADARQTPPPVNDSQRLQRIEEAIVELSRLSKRALGGQPQGKRDYDQHVGANKGKERAAANESSTYPVSLDWTQLALETPSHCSLARLAQICMGMPMSGSFQDPVELGILSMMEMQCVYNQFKEDFGRLLPVSDYLFGCSPQQLPEHAFVRAAIVHHVAAGSRKPTLSRHQCLQIYQCIQDNLIAVQTAEPSRDVLRALLILTYCPNRRYEAPFAAPDPFRAAVLAHDIAKEMCFDMSLARLPALKPADMQYDWNRSLIDEACLWYAIAHRYRWASLLKSVGLETGLSTDRSINNTLPSSFVRETGSPILEHLFAESTLLEIISPLGPLFRRYSANLVMPYNPVEYEEGQLRMEAAHSRFTIWRTDHRSSSLKSMEELLTSSYYVQFCLCMKVSLVIHDLPKPLGSDFLLPLMNRAGQGLIACSADLLERIAAVKISFDRIPHYFLDLTFLPLGMARSFNLVGMSSDIFTLTQNTLQYVSKRLRAAHPSMTALLPRFDTAVNALVETPTPSADSPQATYTVGHSGWLPDSATHPLPEFLQGMLHSDFAAWPTNLDPFGLGTMIWPGVDDPQLVASTMGMTPLENGAEPIVLP